MNKGRIFKFLFPVVFVISFLLCLALTLLNRQANDSHMGVVTRILQTKALPTMRECGECYQPKLFHYTAAVVIQGLGLAHASVSTQWLVAQLINFVAGMITLAIVWIFITKLPFKNELLKLLAFALTALNLAIIGINAQATNDTFAILFSTLALYFTYLFCRKQKIGFFLLIILFTTLGIVSKAHAWVTAIAILIVLITRIFIGKAPIKKAVLFSTAFLVLVPALTIINPLSQYIVIYQIYGTPIPFNVSRPPLPYLAAYTPGCEPHNIYCRPGILSVKSGLFTFKYISLLEHPRNEGVSEGYPAFQTSFWTFMYAEAYSIHFPNFPVTWRTRGTTGFALTRGIFVLALLPTILILAGLAIEFYMLFKGIFRRDSTLAESTSHGLFAWTFVGYLSFVAL